MRNGKRTACALDEPLGREAVTTSCSAAEVLGKAIYKAVELRC